MSVEIERLGETVTPVIDVWNRPEWAFLRQERLVAIGMVPLAANVAGISRFQISNPAGSGVIVVITAMAVLEQTATATYFLTDSGAFIAGGLAPLSTADLRWPLMASGVARATVALQTVDNTAGAASGIILDGTTATLNVITPSFQTVLPVILPPGTWIQAQSSTVNHAARFSVRGYERLAFRGEF